MKFKVRVLRHSTGRKKAKYIHKWVDMYDVAKEMENRAFPVTWSKERMLANTIEHMLDTRNSRAKVYTVIYADAAKVAAQMVSPLQLLALI